MEQNDDRERENESETSDHGILEGSGPGGGAESVEENRPAEERGGSRWLYYLVIALVVVLAAWPIVRIFGVAAETPFLAWMYVVTLVIAIAIAAPFLYALIKKST